MNSQGNVFTDVFALGLLILLVVGLVCWIVPDDGARQVADVMQAALPLGDAAVIEGVHATDKHGYEADAVRFCIREGGMFAIYQKPDGRFLRLCQFPDGVFGMQICADNGSGTCFHEITAFIKNKFHTLEQLLKYLDNMGATKVWP